MIEVSFTVALLHNWPKDKPVELSKQSYSIETSLYSILEESNQTAQVTAKDRAL